MIDVLAAVKAPQIDYLGLAPLFALIGGAIVVLLAGLFPGRFVQRALVPLLAAVALVVAIGFSICELGAGRRQADRRRRAVDRHARAVHVAALLRRRPRRRSLLSLALAESVQDAAQASTSR